VFDISNSFPKFPLISQIFPSPASPPPSTDRPLPIDRLPPNDRRQPTDTVHRPTFSLGPSRLSVAHEHRSSRSPTRSDKERQSGPRALPISGLSLSLSDSLSLSLRSSRPPQISDEERQSRPFIGLQIYGQCYSIPSLCEASFSLSTKSQLLLLNLSSHSLEFDFSGIWV
jgi:hypothetical protein